MNRKMGWMGWVAGFGLMLSACNSGDGVTAVNATDLEGKWNFTKAELHFSSKTTPANERFPDYKVDTVINANGLGYFIEFKHDKTYTSNTPPVPSKFLFGKAGAAAVTETGTWSTSGNSVVLVTSDKDTSAFQVSISGKPGTFSAGAVDTMSQETYKVVSTSSSTITATKE